ncbi:glycosyltransferase [Actinophytocola sp. KF-1]
MHALLTAKVVLRDVQRLADAMFQRLPRSPPTGRPVETLPPLPANARAAEFLPYEQLLPKTAVHVTNGGYGGVQYALRHGVPIVAAGAHEDKAEVIARVAWSGAGRRLRTEHPPPSAEPSAPSSPTTATARPRADWPPAWLRTAASSGSPRSSTT